MPRIQLPDEIAQLHLAFRGKRLTGEINKRVQLFKKVPKFKQYCDRAAEVYGLSPRELCLHVALACMISPECLTRSRTVVQYPTDLNYHMVWEFSIQGHQFWDSIGW